MPRRTSEETHGAAPPAAALAVPQAPSPPGTDHGTFEGDFLGADARSGAPTGADPAAAGTLDGGAFLTQGYPHTESVSSDREGGRVVAGRYLLEAQIGEGGYGQVWRGTDRFTERRVAVKLMYGADLLADHRARLQQEADRELTALRWLDIPGVVELIDDGVDRDQTFIVMGLVQGRPFPGALPLVDAARGLLEILERVHRAGVVHRDLKPANVLVDRAGRITVLDLGLALGAALATEHSQGVFRGTPRYAAPEQCRGGPVEAPADLFALGVMLHEAQTGRAPHDALPLRVMLHTRAYRPVPPLDGDSSLIRLINRLLALAPEERPTAAEALISLGAGSPDGRLPVPPPSARGPRDLDVLIDAPEVFLHLRSDAADLLWARTGGDPERVQAELSSWVRAGLAEPGPRGLEVRREALVRLQPSPPLESAAAALAKAEQALEQGALVEARRTLDLGLRMSRGEAPRTRRLLELLAVHAIAAETNPALQDALYEVGRSEANPPRWLTHLLHGAAAAMSGQVEHARQLLGSVPMPAHPLVRAAWCAKRVQAASRVAAEAQAAELDAVLPFLEAPPLRAVHTGWLGTLRYREGRYVEAARLHEAASQEKAAEHGKIASLLNAAAAWLEVPDLERARELAVSTGAQARRARLASTEAQLCWIERAARYRSGEDLEPQRDLVDAARHVSAIAGAQMGLGEAAIAWRRQAPCVDLALTAARDFQASGVPAGAQLAQALAAAAGADHPLPDELLGPSDVRLQVLALHATTEPLGPGERALATALARAIDPAGMGQRRDVLSPEEALHRCLTTVKGA